MKKFQPKFFHLFVFFFYFPVFALRWMLYCFPVILLFVQEEEERM